MFRVSVGDSRTVPEAMLETGYVRCDICISGELPLVDTRPIDEQPGVIQIRIVGLFMLVCPVAGGWLGGWSGVRCG